jgi:hypothetical protein
MNAIDFLEDRLSTKQTNGYVSAESFLDIEKPTTNKISLEEAERRMKGSLTSKMIESAQTPTPTRDLGKFMQETPPPTVDAMDFLTRVVPESAVRTALSVPLFFADVAKKAYDIGDTSMGQPIEQIKGYAGLGKEVVSGIAQFMGEPIGAFGWDRMKAIWTERPADAVLAILPIVKGSVSGVKALTEFTKKPSSATWNDLRSAIAEGEQKGRVVELRPTAETFLRDDVAAEVKATGKTPDEVVKDIVAPQAKVEPTPVEPPPTMPQVASLGGEVGKTPSKPETYYNVRFDASKNKYNITPESNPYTSIAQYDPETGRVYTGTTHGEIWEAVRINEKRKLSDKSINGFLDEQGAMLTRDKKAPVSIEPPTPIADVGKTVKQPWEMTREEWIANQDEAMKDSPLADRIKTSLRANAYDHAPAVSLAVEQGKSVPPKVLAEYPDLAPKLAEVAKTVEPVESGYSRTASNIQTDIKAKDFNAKEYVNKFGDKQMVFNAAEYLLNNKNYTDRIDSGLLSRVKGIRKEAERQGNLSITPTIEPVTETPAQIIDRPPIGETGIKNAVTTAEREARGLTEIEGQMKKVLPAFEEGKRLVESGERDPRMLAKELSERPRTHTDEEAAMLIYDRMRLQKEQQGVRDTIVSAMDEGNTVKEAEARVKLSELEEAYNVNDVASRQSGTEWSAAGRMRQQMIKEDYSLAAMVQRARIDNGGKPVSDAMRVKLEGLSKRIEEADAKIKTYEEQAASREAEKSIFRIRAEVAKEVRQTKRTYAKEQLSAEFDVLNSQLGKLLGGRLNVGFDPEAALILGKMAKNRVQSGVITVEGVVDSIYTAIKSMDIEVTKRDIRDAISGYGITATMSKDAMAVQLRELKHQMRLVSALEDAQAGQSPLRSGLQRDRPSDMVRELDRQVKQAMRESGIDSTKTRTPEEQWKTALDAVKTRLKHQITDINNQLVTGEKTPKKVGIKYDAEANALKEFRDKMKGLLEDMEGKTQMSAEQKVKNAMAATEKSILEYERRIKENDLAPHPKVSTTPITPELTRLRSVRDKLKETYQAMQKEARPQKTPEEIAIQSFKTRTTNRIKELESKTASSDFTTKERKPLALDAEGLRLKFELDKATRAYHEARFKNQMENRNVFQKAASGVGEAINLSRAIKTSFDLSAVLRQGAFIGLSHPIRSVKSLPAMFKAMVSEKGRFAVDQEILSRPNYRLYEQGKLYLSEHGQKLSQMEEAYMSRWADKIPGVAASQRAYTTYLNELRANSFDGMLKMLPKEPTTLELSAISNYINVATGRGTTGMKANALVGLNTVFFAPRFVLSRFQMIAGQPLYKGSAATRLLIATEYARILGGIGVIYGLALGSGADITFDPRSSDFGKIRYGNTRVDPLAGLSQITTLGGRLISGETKTASGRVIPIRGANVPYGSSNSADVMARFLRSKLSPVVGMGVNVATGKNVSGEPVTPTSVVKDVVMPLSFNDIYEVMKEQGVPAGSALSMLSIFGMGLQTYDNKKQRP